SSTSSSSINTVKAGDVIRYRNDGHSIYVTAVYGDTITFTDCNYDGRCGIRWDATISKSTVKSSFTKLYISPFDSGSYTLTLDANGGYVSYTSIAVVNGGKVGDLPVPEREGYNFDGWFTSPTGGSEITSDSTVNLNLYYTLYAHWTKIIYSVTFDANGGTGTLPKSFTKEYGESVTIGTAKPVRKGYTFVCWNTNSYGTGTDFKPGDNYITNASATLYAKWEANQYLVSFNANGGTVKPTSKKFTYDSPYGELPIPEKTGYRFIGWYTSSTGNEAILSTDIVTITSTTTFYARWEVQTYTIAYDANGGTNAPSTQIKTYGKFIIISSVQPKRTGFIFKNWNTLQSGLGKTYKPGDSYSKEEDIVLYAQWEREKYLLEFYKNGGVGLLDSSYKEFGIAYTFKMPDLAKEGYTFTGWNTSSSGTGTHYSVGDKYTENKPAEFYAEWKPNEYVLRFYANGGINSVNCKTVTYNSEYGVLPIPERPGYTFDGWFTDKSAGNQIDESGIVDILSDTPVFAHWHINTYTVNYLANGGSNAPVSQIKTHGTDILLSSDLPVREGYTFVSWNTDKNGKGTKYRPGEAISLNKNVTLYAIWQTAEYTVKFDLNGGYGNFEDMTLLHGREQSIPSQKPLKDGYGFMGWSTNKNENTGLFMPGSSITVDEDTIFYAIWAPETLSVFFEANGGQCYPVSKELKYGETFDELPSPQKEGYEFAGWFFDDDLTEEVYPDTVINKTEPFTLYADWKPSEYKIYLNACGGEVAPSLIWAEYNSATETLPVPQRDGCIFDGWYMQNGEPLSDDMTVKNDMHLYAHWSFESVQKGTENYTITWSYAGNTFEESYAEGEVIIVFDPVPEDGYIFTGWNKAVPSVMPGENLSFDAVYMPEQYMIEFVASGKSVKKIAYDSQATGIDEPEVPAKAGYCGKWESYDLGENYRVVNAEYTPEIYYADFTADSAVIERVAYTIESFDIVEPDVPVKTGYLSEWDNYSLTPGGVVINAVYIPIKYTAYFVANGIVVGTADYYIASVSVEEPDIPAKAGYSASWFDYSLSENDTYIYAKYTPIVYNGIFAADGTTVQSFEYTVETIAVDEPDVPEKDGYAGVWEDYSFMPGGMTINAVYTPKKYKVTFVADGITIKETLFTYGDTGIEMPAIPPKEGYTAQWSNFVLTCADITCQAIYTPVVYTIRFVADGILVLEKGFTIENTYIRAPEIPYKEGYTAHWEAYTVGPYDITVNAVYEGELHIDIIKYVSVREVEYMSTVVFYYDADGLEDGQRVNWIVNSTNYGEGNKDGSIEVRDIKDSFKIKAVIVDGSKTIMESDTEIITVKKGFFAKIKAFFRRLFRRLPVIHQK
ncbi:MAG: InlB B-repeat-containing protein, partial [Clostridia bacterium]|nr:InlB B-repeat-containing protein [Clostridia bacterium]